MIEGGFVVLAVVIAATAIRGEGWGCLSAVMLGWAFIALLSAT